MKMYGIKNCDTVKKAQKYLQLNNIEFEFGSNIFNIESSIVELNNQSKYFYLMLK